MTKMQSLSDLGLPKNFIDIIKARVVEPFYYLEYGQHDLREARAYSNIDYMDGWYEGEVDQAGEPCGKGIMFKRIKNSYQCSEGFWKGGIMERLGRSFAFDRDTQVV